MQNTSIQPYKFTIDSAINEWIAEKFTRTHSPKTETAYRNTITQFRAFIAPHYDLLDNPVDIARIASIWADRRLPDDERKPSHRRGNADEPVAPGSYNQRLAILSSWYSFVQEKYKVDIINPMKADSVARRPVQAYAAALPIDADEVVTGLDSIDRTVAQGKRDYAILAVALYTGRRASELVGLRWEHVKISGRRNEQRITLTFHCKGAKIKKDKLDVDTSAVLLDYLYAQYGRNLLNLSLDTPVWVSYSRQNSGKAISAKTLSNICEAHLSTSKVHATRHTWTVGMVRSGAPITEIADRLGHTDIKITQAYTREVMGDENPFGEKLSSRFGIKPRATRR